MFARCMMRRKVWCEPSVMVGFFQEENFLEGNFACSFKLWRQLPFL